MSEKKNAPLGAGTPNRAVETGTASRQATTSTHDSTPSAAGRQPLKIGDILLMGERNALPLRHLKSVTGMNGREIRRMIQTERMEGTPILSNCVGGYYLPDSEDERQRCVRSLRRRAGEIMETAAAIEEAEV